jgi:hypothetical protein
MLWSETNDWIQMFGDEKKLAAEAEAAVSFVMSDLQALHTTLKIMKTENLFTP